MEKGIKAKGKVEKEFFLDLEVLVFKRKSVLSHSFG